MQNTERTILHLLHKIKTIRHRRDAYKIKNRRINEKIALRRRLTSYRLTSVRYKLVLFRFSSFGKETMRTKLYRTYVRLMGVYIQFVGHIYPMYWAYISCTLDIYILRLGYICPATQVLIA